MRVNEVTLRYTLLLSSDFILTHTPLKEFAAQDKTTVFFDKTAFNIGVVCLFYPVGGAHQVRHVIFVDENNTELQKTELLSKAWDSERHREKLRMETVIQIPEDIAEKSVVVFVPALIAVKNNEMFYYSLSHGFTATERKKVGGFSSKPLYEDAGVVNEHSVRHVGGGSFEVNLYPFGDSSQPKQPDAINFNNVSEDKNEIFDKEAIDNITLKDLHTQIFNELCDMGLEPTASSDGTSHSDLIGDGFTVFIRTDYDRVSGNIVKNGHNGKDTTPFYIKPEAPEAMATLFAAVDALLGNDEIEDGGDDLADEEETAEPEEEGDGDSEMI